MRWRWMVLPTSSQTENSLEIELISFLSLAIVPSSSISSVAVRAKREECRIPITTTAGFTTPATMKETLQISRHHTFLTA